MVEVKKEGSSLNVQMEEDERERHPGVGLGASYSDEGTSEAHASHLSSVSTTSSADNDVTSTTSSCSVLDECIASFVLCKA